MPLIKRYPNRKLYDTQTKQYITLDGIADLIRNGEEVHVVDFASGEDLTALTLTQVIMEMEKKQSGFLPRSVLAGLIQAGGHSFSSLQRKMAASLNFWHNIDEEIKSRIQGLVDIGELSEGDAIIWLEKLLSQSKEPSSVLNITEAEFQRVLDQRQVPHRDDLQSILEQLEILSAKLDEIQKSPPPSNL